MVHSLPTGTVTFLFTDVQSSTELWDRKPVAMQAALERHDEILRGAIADHDGYVFSTAGDAFAASFHRVDAAVDAAVTAQRNLATGPWPNQVRLKVRMGLHTGEAHERGGDYFGGTLNRAARVMSAGHGGQILVSETTASLISMDEITTRSIGSIALRGLDRSEAVSQLHADGLETEFPALKSTVRVGNLLPPRDATIGRAQELERLRDLFQGRRLVTLTGVGGAGKTRIATTFGREHADECNDGVWFVELADIARGDQVATAIADTTGFQDQAGQTGQRGLLESMSGLRLLLILDNCEHVLEGVADLVDELLDVAPHVSVLCTSREGLGLPGEHIIAVRSLDATSATSPAVELFIERAVSTGWTPADLEAVAELCQRLDGLPLAIELAAARVNTMPVGEIGARLNQRFDLLQGRRRGAERHQTLRSTVAWSIDSLEAEEQELFDRLSVFTGPFTLSDAESVCGEGWDSLVFVELVERLVEKSILGSETGRFRLLETLSDYGAERLGQNGDPHRWMHAHMAHYAQLVVDCREGLLGPDAHRWLRHLESAWPNITTAVERALDVEDLDAVLTIACHSQWARFWHGFQGPSTWCAAAVQLPQADAHPLYATALAVSSQAAFFAGDMSAAETLIERAREVRSEASNDLDYWIDQTRLSLLLWSGREADGADQQMIEALRLSGDDTQLACWTAMFAANFRRSNPRQRTLEAVERSRALADRTQNPTAVAWSLWAEATVVLDEDPRTALDLSERAILVAPPDGWPGIAAYSQINRARSLTLLGQPAEALFAVSEPLRPLVRRGLLVQVWSFLLDAGHALLSIGAPETAAKLLGCAVASPAAELRNNRELIATLRARLIDTLGPEEARQQIVLGENLRVIDAVELIEAACESLATR